MTQERQFLDRLSATLSLDESTTSISGVREARARALASMGMHTVRDVLTHFPRRYMDLTKVRTSATAQIGEHCTMAGVVHEVKLKRPKRKLSIVEITLLDSDGTFIVSVFNRSYLADQIKAGSKLIVAGKTEFNYGFLRMTNPYIETYEGGEVQGKVIPVHPATSKISTAQMRNIVKSALQATTGALDILPANLRSRRGLISRQQAFRAIHFPKDIDEANIARTRLAYEELLMLQLFMIMESNARSKSVTAHSHVVNGKKVEKLYTSLPFELTADQKTAVSDLLASLAEDRVTSRMLLGDVGTGKTIVSAFGMASAADSGTQTMMLAPTEVLAEQHHLGLGKFLDSAGVTHAHLSSSTNPEKRKEILSGFASGDIDVLIGTHAILEPDVVGKNVSFVIIDEQQRFGVEQREKALAKGNGADSLFMTATPIPRTLALTLFGGMELSYLHKKPNTGAGRTTKVLEKRQRGTAFDKALEALRCGCQVYIVCPLIGEKSEKPTDDTPHNNDLEDDFVFDDIVIEDDGDLIGEEDSLAAANQEAEFLQKQVFHEYNVGLLHGNLTSDEKSSVMDKFRKGEIDVLVSTTVIEVGVDVPNATVMIIEDADRFGLSQLHQLRGRVGRGKEDGHIFLISSSKHPKALKRLQALEASDDGFEIAQYDLSLRREGDILGNKQSGASSLKIVNVVRDSALVQAAHEDAIKILEEDPNLEMREHAGLAREVRLAFEGEHSRSGG